MGPEHCTDLIGKRDGHDPSLLRDRPRRGGGEDEPTDYESTVVHRQLDLTSRKAELVSPPDAATQQHVAVVLNAHAHPRRLAHLVPAGPQVEQGHQLVAHDGNDVSL